MMFPTAVAMLLMLRSPFHHHHHPQHPVQHHLQKHVFIITQVQIVIIQGINIINTINIKNLQHVESSARINLFKGSRQRARRLERQGFASINSVS